MQPSFQHGEAFPLIARAIAIFASGKDRFVTHDEVVAALLSDPEGATLAADARASAKWETDRQAASNMVAWFSQQITVGESPWVQFFDRKRVGGAWAYRPKTAAPSPIAEDIELALVEGEPRFFFHLRRERNPALRKAKIEALLEAGLEPSCEACGLITKVAFPALNAEILEVHHRLPLSASSSSVITGLPDLALLCPNCRRAIHRTRPLPSVETFRQSIVSPLSKGAG